MDILSRSARIIQDVLSEKGINFKVIELSESTRTAQDAANALGCEIGQIVKSLIFKIQESNEPILILASGPNRVNEEKIALQLGKKITKADADFTREVTGFAIGGIPPLGHKQKIKTFIDHDLFKFDELWAAAGTPNAVFSVKSSDLQMLTDGTIVAIYK